MRPITNNRRLRLLLCLTLLLGLIPSTVWATGDGGHTHTPSEWRTTQVYHYKVCTTCGEFLEQEDHYGGEASCAYPTICDACGYAYQEAHENHTPDTVWTACGTLYHAYLCKICGAHCTPEEHIWSPRYHTVDARGHAYQCADCMGYDEILPHNPGPAATEDRPQTCKDCGYVIVRALPHSHTLVLVPEVTPTCIAPGMNAYYICSGCNKKFGSADSTDPIADGEDLTIPPLGHHPAIGWKYNEDTHWRICSVCEIQMVETDMKHDLKKGKCTTCDFVIEQPETTPAVTVPQETTTAATETQPQPPVENPGGIPWWVLLLVGIGAAGAGVGATYFMLKKKS